MNKQVQQKATGYWGLIILLATMTALDAMSIDLYLPAFQQIEYALNTSTSQVQNTLSIFFIGLAVGQAVYGPLLDRYGRKLPLIIGCALFTLGSFVAAVAPNIETLLFARLLQALGAAVGIVAPRAVVSDRFDVSESAKVFSLLMQIFMIVPVVAPILGAWISAEWGWRSIFWVLTAAGAFITVWTIICFDESLAVSERQTLGFSQICRAYLSLFGRPVFILYVLASSFCMAAFFGYLTNTSFVFLGYFSLTEQQFSYVFAAVSVGIIIAGQINSWLLRVFSEFSIVLAGFIISVLCGALMLVVTQQPEVSLKAYIALLIIAVCGMGLTFGNLQALIMNQAGKELGIASALIGVMQYSFGAAAGIVLAAHIIALPLMFVICGCLSVLALLLGRRYQQP